MAKYIDVDKVTYNKIKESSLADDLTERELTTIIQVFRNLPTEEIKQTDGDLISRQAVIQALKDNVVEIGGEEYSGMGVCEEEIESIVNGVPSAEKTAEWIIKHKVTNSGSFWEIKCSNCEIESDSIYRYCPYCGAKMEESE